MRLMMLMLIISCLIEQCSSHLRLTMYTSILFQVGVEPMLASNAMEQLLLCDARLHNPTFASLLVTEMLADRSMQQSVTIQR